MPADEDTIDWDDLSWLEKSDITNNDVSNVDNHFGTTSDDFDRSVFSLFIELFELTFFLPIINGTDEDDDEDSNADSNTLDPVYLWWLTTDGGKTIFAVEDGSVINTEILVETEGKGDNSGDRKQDLK